MTNGEYLEQKIKNIKKKVENFLTKKPKVMTFICLLVTVISIYYAVTVNMSFLIIAIPFAYFTILYLVTVICNWLDAEHKEKE
jgi:hypothetical protein